MYGIPISDMKYMNHLIRLGNCFLDFPDITHTTEDTMANLADAIAQSFADRYDPQKQAVSKIMSAEADKIQSELPKAKLLAGMEVYQQLGVARAADPADQDWINFLTKLLNELNQI